MAADSPGDEEMTITFPDSSVERYVIAVVIALKGCREAGNANALLFLSVFPRLVYFAYDAGVHRTSEPTRLSLIWIVLLFRDTP